MAVIVSDTFTELLADTTLQTHVPDTGTGWTEFSSCAVGRNFVVFFLLDDMGANGSSGNCIEIYTAQPDPSVAEYDVQVTTTVITTFTVNPAGLVARLTDINNHYTAGSYIASAAADKKIFKMVAGTRTELASGDNGLTAGDVFKFEVRDATKKLYQNAVEILSSTDNAITGAGQAGLFEGAVWVNTDDVQGVWRFDAFTVDEVAAAGATWPGWMSSRGGWV